KNTYLKKLFLTIILGGAFLLPQVVEGKSVSWSTTSIPELYYVWSWNVDLEANPSANYGWAPGLKPNANATVTYIADIRNADTGAAINDGDTLAVGTRVTFDIPLDNSQISWNGTGDSGDSPNGHWTNNAAYPTDSTLGDLVATGVMTGGSCGGEIVTLPQMVDVYVPLSVNPPNIQIVPSGTATVVQENSTTFRVTGSGSLGFSVNYPATSGKFYYMYNNDIFCGFSSDNRIAMADKGVLQWDSCGYKSFDGKTCYGSYSKALNPYNSTPKHLLNVPAQQIVFNLTVPSNNNNPNPPSLTGPTSGSTSTSYPFNTQATDPDSDTLHYGMDWDNNNTVDEWMPASGYVPSNTTQTFNHQWATPGTYTIKALAQDSKGGTSGWSIPLTITISTIVNGVCGSANAFPTTNPPTIGLCFQGANTPVTPGAAPGPYSWTCQGSGGGTNASCSAPYLPPAPDFNFQINGVVANGSLTVARNANLNIIWNNVTNATSCSGTGNSWAGGKATIGGNDNIQATAASLYQLSCTGPGGTTTKQISVTLQPTLKICQNSCSGSIEPPASFSMNRYDTKNLVACFNDAASCTDSTGDVTTSATWSEGGGNPISISGGSPKTLTADNVGTESFQASYNSNTVTRSVTVTCTDAGACQRDSRSQSLCQKDTFTITDNCGVTQNCTGEKTCDYNWKEVAP
nr:hypothetical protein [Candidatus Moranbacteria bacterium]